MIDFQVIGDRWFIQEVLFEPLVNVLMTLKSKTYTLKYTPDELKILFFKIETEYEKR